MRAQVSRLFVDENEFEKLSCTSPRSLDGYTLTCKAHLRRRRGWRRARHRPSLLQCCHCRRARPCYCSIGRRHCTAGKNPARQRVSSSSTITHPSHQRLPPTPPPSPRLSPPANPLASHPHRHRQPPHHQRVDRHRSPERRHRVYRPADCRSRVYCRRSLERRRVHRQSSRCQQATLWPYRRRHGPRCRRGPQPLRRRRRIARRRPCCIHGRSIRTISRPHAPSTGRLHPRSSSVFRAGQSRARPPWSLGPPCGATHGSRRPTCTAAAWAS